MRTYGRLNGMGDKFETVSLVPGSILAVLGVHVDLSASLLIILLSPSAFQTAVAFAEYRFLQLSPEEREGEDGKATLEDQDFAKVCEMIIAFHEYMNSIHGGDEARRARMERIRDDSFKEISSFL